MIDTAVSYEFPLSRPARQRYAVGAELAGRGGAVELADIRAVRLLTQRINEVRRTAGETSALRSGEMVAAGLIDGILHAVTGLFVKSVDHHTFSRALAFVEARVGRPEAEKVLRGFVEEFPPRDVQRGTADAAGHLAAATNGRSNRELALDGLLQLWLAETNNAFEPFQELFLDPSQAGVEARAGAEARAGVLGALEDFFRAEPAFGPDNQDLVTMLRSPAVASPRSLAGQLEYIRTRWASLLGDLLLRLLTGIDILREEERMHFGAFTPGKPEVYDYGGQHGEVEAFSADRDWMPRVVMLAKNALVWMDQLSRAFSRPITRLDQVPDEELDRLASAGFSALWLIGVWERSRASRRIKQMMGNPDAEASAYSLSDYRVAEELGGEEALVHLRDRAWRRGIRLASDMVPNHTGIDSRWLTDHPDRFLSYPRGYPPFPAYSFNGPNLSDDPRVGVYIEDHYATRTDAAVVFKRVDHWTGNTRYVYHGNDGTHMPWNDTAQLDFLNPETREAVIRTILHVARLFPIIRFDAAMTLTKKHYQRLWYPEPGRGGDIPSRAECGLTRFDFDHAMPGEFWREVVDRAAAEAPDTLLLAEAFWLLEGFFVRTLGMHRVYNSAFMNMLKAEDNAGYRQAVKNTLEFDPEVLKRFVNFMSNPDEETAIEQFGNGDKYFGVCVLMATMPGLPMFAHGQIEGLREKYGMEFRRAYWSEETDDGLVRRHAREIFPLLKKRYLFCGVDGFLLYDLCDQGGRVNEDVFAYSNRNGGERALVLYNNRYAEARGWIRASAAYAAKSAGGKSLVRGTLGEGLGLSMDSHVIFRDHVSGLEYIRPSRQVHESGMYVELGAYKHQVFLDFREVAEAPDGRWTRLEGELGGRGVPSVDAALREMQLSPVFTPFSALVNAEACRAFFAAAGADDAAEGRVEEWVRLYGEFLAGAARMAPASVAGTESLAAYRSLLEGLWGLCAAAGAKPAAGAEPALWTWAALRPLCGAPSVSEAADSQAGPAPVCAALSWLDDWDLGRAVRDCAAGMGWDEAGASRAGALLWVLMGIGSEVPATAALRSLLGDPAAEGFLQVNAFQGARWLRKESLEVLMEAMRAAAAVSRLSGALGHAAGAGRTAAAAQAEARAAEVDRGRVLSCLTAAAAAGYRWDDFLHSLD